MANVFDQFDEDAGVEQEQDPTAQQAEKDQSANVFDQFDEKPFAIEDVLGYGADLVTEAAAAVNRGAVEIADLPGEFGNAVLQLLGSGERIPKFADINVVQQATAGGFMEPGLDRDIVWAGGELVAPAPPVAAAVKQGSRALSKTDDLAAQAQRFSKEFAGSTPAQKIVDEAVPDSLPPVNVPGAKNAEEVIKAAEKPQSLRNG